MTTHDQNHDKESRRIHKLSTQLANQIAAGEVIERPASVLKELLENSIDAGSSRIEVTLEHSGHKLIRIQDNGCGICKEDLALAIAQHATSKIRNFSDLEQIRSLGFRGEALSSIVSVSHFSLTSWVPPQETGWTISCEGRDNNIVLRPAPKLPGTLIEVKDLFYNTPARRKFLRSNKTEMIHLEEMFKKIAISQPNITFILKQEDKILKQLNNCLTEKSITHRIANLCGQHFIKNSVNIDAEANGLKLKGWLGNKDATRAQSDLQYFYVNGRIIRDKLITHAIRQAYQTHCPEGRYPSFVLFLELDPESVDVNVHPTKYEVRFRESRTVHAFLSYCIQEGLNQLMVSQPMGSGTASSLVPGTMPVVVSGTVSPGVPLVPGTVSSMVPVVPGTTMETLTPVVETVNFGKPLAFLGQEILITECEHQFKVVDIKALRFLLYKEILKQGYETGTVVQKNLFIPISFEVNDSTHIRSRVNSLNEREDAYLKLWEQLGFVLTQSGNKKVILRKIPAIFPSFEVQSQTVIQELLCIKNITDIIRKLALHLSSLTLNWEDIESFLKNYETFLTLEMMPQTSRHITIQEFRRIFNFNANSPVSLLS